MVLTDFGKLWLAAFTLAAWILFPAQSHAASALPQSLGEYAQKMQPTLNVMVASDPSLLKQIGVGKEALAQSQLAYNAAFPLYRVDATKAGDAHEMASAVKPTGIYYIPYCVNGQCPLVAAFTMDAATGQPTFVSVGQPTLSRRVQDADARLRMDPDLAGTGERRVVEFPEAHVNFSLVQRADNGEAVLVPHTPQEAQALLKMVKNPNEILRTRTHAGLFTFRHEHVSEIVSYLKENIEPDYVPTAAQLQGEREKPANPGPHGNPVGVAPGPTNGAVLDIDTTPAQSAKPGQPADKPEAAPSYESASARIPGYLLLPIIAFSVFFAMLAWLFRKVKSAV